MDKTPNPADLRAIFAQAPLDRILDEGALPAESDEVAGRHRRPSPKRKSP